MNALWIDLIGLVIGFITAIVDYVESKKLKDAFIHGVMVGGVCFCATALLQIRYQDTPRLEELLGYSKSMRPEDDALKLLKSFSQATERVNSSDSQPLKRSFQYFTTPLRERFENYANGQFKVRPAEMSEYGPELIKSAQQEIWATSAVNPDRWWDTDWGKLYLNENYEAVKRGVKITRVFIVRDESEAKRILPLVQAQAGKKIGACYVIDKAFEQDLLVIDGKFAGELRLRGEGFQEAEFYVNEAKAKAFQQSIYKLSQECRRP